MRLTSRLNYKHQSPWNNSNPALDPVTDYNFYDKFVQRYTGRVAATWDVTVAAVNREALIVNGLVALLEGDLVDWNGDGTINASDNNGKLADFTGIRAVSVGERLGGGSFFDVFFTADIDFNGTTSSTDDLEGGFSYRFVVPEPGSASLLAGAAALLLARRQRRGC